MTPSFALIVPTLNAASRWPAWVKALRQQSVQPHTVVIIDSDSSDSTAALAREAGFQVQVISQRDFNHGGTRDWGASLVPKSDLLLFMTDDAILASTESLRKLVEAFQDERVGAAFGRQLPRDRAGAFEAHARYFNYSSEARTVRPEDISRYGSKSVFFSNSFAAYRRSAFEQCGGFPRETILCEDVFLAAKLLQGGWSLAYVPEAVVYHSHAYTAVQEFKRYFDIGVFHSRERWIGDSFGRHGGEGMRFIASETNYLLKNSPRLLFVMPVRIFAKAAGYYLGKIERALPVTWKKRISMHRRFWDAPHAFRKTAS
jgi:rhamnosyltransferase